MSKLRFTDPRRSGFFAAVRQRTDAYFKENNLSKNANGFMWFKTVLFLGSLVGLYCLIVFGNFGLGTMLFLAILLGMTCAFIGFNVSHDAIHGAFTSSASTNRMLSHTFNVLGANPYMWSLTHNLVHHTYTNIPGHDDDLEIAPGLIRITEEDTLKPVHRYQHIYGFLLYGLASFSWVFRKDYVKFFKPQIGQTVSDHPKREYFNLFFFKGLYYILFIAVPLIVMPITWWQFMLGFLVMHFAEGLVLGLVFQLAHVVEATDFPEPNTDGNIEEAWAVHQMHTTANFSLGNPIVNFFCGGLNQQIEHHLFPKICHVHYPALSKIVQQTAHEYGVPYHVNETFVGAMASHYRVLRKFGKEALEAAQPVSLSSAV